MGRKRKKKEFDGFLLLGFCLDVGDRSIVGILESFWEKKGEERKTNNE